MAVRLSTLLPPPVKDAMKMEDAMAEIRKVVDFFDPDGGSSPLARGIPSMQ